MSRRGRARNVQNGLYIWQSGPFCAGPSPWGYMLTDVLSWVSMIILQVFPCFQVPHKCKCLPLLFLPLVLALSGFSHPFAPHLVYLREYNIIEVCWYVDS